MHSQCKVPKEDLPISVKFLPSKARSSFDSFLWASSLHSKITVNICKYILHKYRLGQICTALNALGIDLVDLVVFYRRSRSCSIASLTDHHWKDATGETCSCIVRYAKEETLEHVLQELLAWKASIRCTKVFTERKGKTTTTITTIRCVGYRGFKSRRRIDTGGQKQARTSQNTKRSRVFLSSACSATCRKGQLRRLLLSEVWAVIVLTRGTKDGWKTNPVEKRQDQKNRRRTCRPTARFFGRTLSVTLWPSTNPDCIMTARQYWFELGTVSN